MIRWLDARPAPQIRWLGGPSSGRLGLFEEPTYTDCAANEANKNACYYSCIAAGSSGWNALLATACQSVCITEACGNGILLTPRGLQKVVPKIADCLTYCRTQAEKLSDSSARAAALAACPSTCMLAAELAKLPPEDKQNAKTAPIPQPPGTPAASKSAPSSDRGLGSVLIIAALVAAAVVIVGGSGT
jgi:hypothetical protein